MSSAQFPLQSSRSDWAPDAESNRNSYANHLHYLDCERGASRYPSEFNGSFRQQREKRVLNNLLGLLSQRSLVLDLPCGTGRVTQLILQAGHRVIGGDSAPQMLSRAEQKLKPEFPATKFRVMQAAETGLPDKSVDAVMCNRLFHHFAESAVRISVLRELNRISRGPVIVSFSNSFGADVVWTRLKRRLQGRTLRHYFPIPIQQFRNEFAEAGLTVVATRAVMWGFSRMWYVVGSPSRSGIRADSA